MRRKHPLRVTPAELSSMIRSFLGACLAVVLPFATSPAASAQEGRVGPGEADRAASPFPPAGPPAPASRSGSRGRQAPPVEPPRCRENHGSARRPARSDNPRRTPAFRPLPPGIPPVPPGMPPAFAQMFQQMSQAMATNPATAFDTFVRQMSRMEESSIRDVRLDAREERAIGRRALEQYLSKAAEAGHKEVRDESRQKYLESLVATFAARMKNRSRYPNIEVYLIDAPVADGQCFPGGFLVFTTGLLDEPDEATVAGFVAHELAHLDRGHVYQYARRTKLAESTFRPGPNANLNNFFTRGMAMMGIMMDPFRPEHEHEADCEAVTWLHQEGYDPTALVGFFSRLAERQRERPDQAPLPFTMLGRSHPFSADRGRHVQSRLDQLQAWRRRDDLGLYADNLRALRPKNQAVLPAAVPPEPDAARVNPPDRP